MEKRWVRSEELHGEATLFVDNLPQNIYKLWLHRILSQVGRVQDIYISRKWRRFKKCLFAFVRMGSEEEACRASRRMNGVAFLGRKLKVSKARFIRKQKENSADTSNNFSKPTHAVQKTKEGSRNMKAEVMKWEKKYEERRVEGIVCQENCDWLKRSIIGMVKSPTEVESIRERLYRDWRTIIGVRDIGWYKFLIMFEREEDVDDALNLGMDLLLESFEVVERWSEEEVCDTRRALVECIGLPLHAWSEQNMFNIGEVWGSVVRVDDSAKSRKSLSSFKLSIDTTYLPIINGWVSLVLNGISFDIHCREVDARVNNVSEVDKRGDAGGMRSEEEEEWLPEKLGDGDGNYHDYRVQLDEEGENNGGINWVDEEVAEEHSPRNLEKYDTISRVEETCEREDAGLNLNVGEMGPMQVNEVSTTRTFVNDVWSHEVIGENRLEWVEEPHEKPNEIEVGESSQMGLVPPGFEAHRNSGVKDKFERAKKNVWGEMKKIFGQSPNRKQNEKERGMRSQENFGDNFQELEEEDIIGGKEVGQSPVMGCEEDVVFAQEVGALPSSGEGVKLKKKVEGRERKSRGRKLRGKSRRTRKRGAAAAETRSNDEDSDLEDALKNATVALQLGFEPESEEELIRNLLRSKKKGKKKGEAGVATRKRLARHPCG